ncbi:MAG: thioesterase [Ignavibacteriaceae bacterium]|jgi:acyl-CoA thioester hydrolase
MDQFSVELKPEIKTYDIDIAGHVNNVVYIRWFEDLRTKLFINYFNLQELLSNNLYPVVISTSIYYKKYLKLFDRPVGTINIEYCSHGIVGLKTVIKRNKEIIAIGKQKCILLNLKTGRMDKEKIKSILKS